MYKIQCSFNYFGATIIKILYAYVGYKINLQYNYTNVCELLVGVAVTTIIMSILEFIFSRIAYKLTGSVSRNCGLDSSERTLIHWTVRILLLVSVYIISITPLCSILITPLVQNCTKSILNWYKGFTDDLTNTLINSLQTLTY